MMNSPFVNGSTSTGANASGYPLAGTNTAGYPSTEAGIATPLRGAGLLSFAIFFLIAFASNAILSSVTLATLGISVTLSLLTFIALIIIILFLF